MTNAIATLVRNWLLAGLVITSSASCAAIAADAADPDRAERERKLIAVLQSQAPAAEKAMTCKKLAIYGSKEAVPALAPLLADAQLASWARIALEAIPDPAAAAALRDALKQVQSRLLVGVINSLGARRDPQAVEVLVVRLADADAEVASAAAAALGQIGGQRAAQALEKALAGAPATMKSDLAEGCILCAEKFQAGGDSAAAVKLYDTIRQADVPPQRRLEAIRGAILARGTGGIPLLIEQLKSPDRGVFGIGLRTARELPGREVTEALALELERTPAERQALVLIALADRGDLAALPAVSRAAQTGSTPVKLAAVGALEKLAGPAGTPSLLELAAASDAAVSRAAKTTLIRSPGSSVDDAVLAGLPKSVGKQRQVLIDLAAQRGVKAALPAIVPCTADADAGVRQAAAGALAALGEDEQVVVLVKLIQAPPNPQDREFLEEALLTLSGRCGANCVPRLMPLAKSSDASIRQASLHALSSAGGPAALAAVNAAVADTDAAVQDEAVRMLSTWPNNWPDDESVAEPLLALARSAKKPSHQVLALRGYLQCVQSSKKLANETKVARVKEVMPLLTSPDLKRSAISTAAAAPSLEALELLTLFTADSAVTEDACQTIVNVATAKELKEKSPEARRKALQVASEKSGSDKTKRKAQDALQSLK